MMVYVDLDLKRPANFLITIQDKLLLVMGELDIGPRPSTIHPITHVTMTDCLLYMNFKEEIVRVMVQDMEVGIKRSTTLPLNCSRRKC